MINKKSVFITVSVLVIIFLGYKISSSVIKNTVDDANKRGIELYASALRYAYTNYLYKNGFEIADVNDLNVKVTTKVECEKKRITVDGDVYLEGCSVENSKEKYKYTNGSVEREK